MEEPQKFEDFCKEQVGALRRFFLARRVSPYDVDDLVQQSFIVLLSKRHRILDGKARSFLFGIAANVLLSFKRKALVERLRRQDDDGSVTEQSAETLPSPAAASVKNERGDLLRKAVSELPTRLQEALNLLYFDGCTHAETARQMGIALSSTYTYEMRALERLQRILKQPQGDSLSWID